MKKLILLLTLVISFQKGFTQTSVFQIMFDNKSDEITKENVNDVYSFITEIDKMVKTENDVENNYVKNFNTLLTNSRVNELDKIVNEIKENLKIETLENKLILTTKFSASNASPINLNNYLVVIENSNFKIDKTSSINSKGIFDYSNNPSMKEITSELKHEFTLEEKIEGNLKLELKIKAFKNCNHRVVTKKDIEKELLGLKLINIGENHIVVEHSNNDFEFLPYKNKKVANVKSKMEFGIYKPIYEYLKSNKKIDIEDLKNKFPIERLKKLNFKGTYKVIIFNDNSLDEILILKKEYKELNMKIEKKL